MSSLPCQEQPPRDPPPVHWTRRMAILLPHETLGDVAESPRPRLLIAETMAVDTSETILRRPRAAPGPYHTRLLLSSAQSCQPLARTDGQLSLQGQAQVIEPVNPEAPRTGG